MTNEQLALLLTSYHDQLVDTFNDLERELREVDGIEIEEVVIGSNWAGEGEEPSSLRGRLEAINDYEPVRAKLGDVILLQPLSNCIDRLYDYIEMLKE